MATTLLHIPEHALGQIVKHPGFSVIRSLCKQLYTDYDACNSIMVLRGGSADPRLAVLRRLLVHHARGITELRTAGSFSGEDLAALRCDIPWGQLRSLDLSGMSGPRTDFTPLLGPCPNLRHLSLVHCLDLSSLTVCTALERLDLFFSTGLVALDPLVACTALRRLEIRLCLELVDISPLSSCSALEFLDLSGGSRLSDLQVQ